MLSPPRTSEVEAALRHPAIRKLMRIAILSLTWGIADCAAESAGRWLNAEKEDVVVAGATYRVNWLPIDGGYDFRSHYNQPLSAMDTMMDKMNNQIAVMIVGQRLCGKKPIIVGETKDGDMFLTRVRCV
jgi:hypothetical protein